MYNYWYYVIANQHLLYQSLIVHEGCENVVPHTGITKSAKICVTNTRRLRRVSVMAKFGTLSQIHLLWKSQVIMFNSYPLFSAENKCVKQIRFGSHFSKSPSHHHLHSQSYEKLSISTQRLVKYLRKNINSHFWIYLNV